MYVPIALATAVLLHLLGVHVGMAMLGKEARQMLRGGSSAFSETLMVPVIGLVGASHCGQLISIQDLAFVSGAWRADALIDGWEGYRKRDERKSRQTIISCRQV